ncbi:hypothetical protein MXB_3094 [Myxobolus squamalis]|nr:hypothetical protein MXB_3094 [Myxobolus squamalis]
MESTDFIKSCWIFGYGSIIWKTSFPYVEKRFGYVQGYTRRFWQGSHDHRGTHDKPGRVATLIPSENESTWGVAYRITQSDWDYVINNLNSRETDGYSCIHAKFYPKIAEVVDTFNVWIYVALPSNISFLGEAPIDSIAQQIIESEGPSGSNIEYLMNLADSLRQIAPNALDHHTSQLEKVVKNKLKIIN